MKTISIPVNDRPQLLAKVLSSICACPQWRDWQLFLACEPPIQLETDQLLTTLSNATFSENPNKLGCWHNTFHSATLAMAAGSKLNLYLEDDYLITPDTLTMIEQWSTSGASGVLCLRRPHAVQDFAKSSVVSLYQTGLFGCGFAWRESEWPIIRDTWFKPAVMWDIAMESLPLQQWRPLVNRSFGVGFIGTHTHGSNSDLNLFGPAYAGKPITNFEFIA